jgi:hypothetical protein
MDILQQFGPQICNLNKKINKKESKLKITTLVINNNNNE